MNYDEFKQCVIAAAAEAGLADYELYYQTSEGLSASAVNREIKEFSSSLEGGVCFRCLVNGRMGYASTELLSVGEAVAIVRRARDNALVLESEETEYLSEGGKTYQNRRNSADLRKAQNLDKEFHDVIIRKAGNDFLQSFTDVRPFALQDSSQHIKPSLSEGMRQILYVGPPAAVQGHNL